MATTGLCAEARFETFGSVLTFGSATNLVTLKTENPTDCARPGEILPAETDQAGNWGFPSENRQLSLWLPKKQYAVGEPVIVSVILRNVGDNTLMDALRRPEAAIFTVTDAQGQALLRQDGLPADTNRPYPPRPRSGGGMTWEIHPNSQRKYKVLLSEVYDLSRPGTYYATTKRFFMRPDKVWGEVASGTAMFEILAAPGQPKATDSETGLSQKGNLTVATSQTVATQVLNSRAPSGNSATTPTDVATATSQSNPPSPLAAKEEASDPRQPAKEHSSSQRSGNGTRVMALWSGLGLLGLIAISWFVLRRKTAQ